MITPENNNGSMDIPRTQDRCDECGELNEIEKANRDLKEALGNELILRREMKEALDAARFANYAKTEFLTRISHDIRTPLNAIVGMTAIAEAHLDNPEKVRDCLEKISASGNHMLEILSDIADISRTEADKPRMREDSFSLPELVTELMEISDPQVRARRHKFKVYIGSVEHENVIGDRVRLRQALLNIISNSVLYAPNGSSITVSLCEKKSGRRKRGVYEFVIEDNGNGMSEELLSRLFEPFERGAEDIRGIGLGMPITKNIIETMGGTVTVQSEAGKGTSVTVTVPLKLGSCEETDTSGLAGLEVLIADADEACCENICRAVKELGMKCDRVQNGKEAIEKVRQRHKQGKDYFAVLLDRELTDPDGMETTRKIRRETGGRLPVIMASAYGWSDIELDARTAGATAFISKPLFRSGLACVFKKLLDPGAELPSEPGSGLKILSQHNFSSKRILLAEDIEINREVISEIIGASGASVETACDGKQAVEMFKGSPKGYYDMILMDIRMPNMDGYEASAAIRSLGTLYCKNIPIIALTADAFENDVNAAYTAGMNEHLEKPVDIVRLNEIMERWLG